MDDDTLAGRPPNVRYIVSPNLNATRCPFCFPFPLMLKEAQERTALFGALQRTQKRGRSVLMTAMELHAGHHLRRGALLRAVKQRFAASEAMVAEKRSDRREYLASIGRARFVFSFQGTGIDCYRHWESLILGAVPVVELSPVTTFFAQFVPMVLLPPPAAAAIARLPTCARSWQALFDRVATAPRFVTFARR